MQSDKIKVTFYGNLYRNVKDWTDVEWNEVGEDNSGYISIEHPNIEGQRFPDEIVIPMNEIRVEYTYPLSKRTVMFFNADNETGFTRAELARKVCEGYQKIYQIEEEAVGNPGNLPGMLNRATSEGPYGIWGHDIQDLVLHTVRQIDGNLFGLGVDS